MTFSIVFPIRNCFQCRNWLSTCQTLISVKSRMSSNVESVETATFAMGCFWMPDALFGVQTGVLSVRVGYTGGTRPNPTYRSLGDHTESTRLEFEPKIISYEKLLDIFWTHHDPTEPHKSQYMSAIFYENDQQRKLAHQSLEERQKKLQRIILTKIVPLDKFYVAENYHQKYHFRQHKWLVDSLTKSMGLTDDQILNSPVIAKLNGYCAKKGQLETFQQEWIKLGLTKEQADYLMQILNNIEIV